MKSKYTYFDNKVKAIVKMYINKSSDTLVIQRKDDTYYITDGYGILKINERLYNLLNMESGIFKILDEDVAIRYNFAIKAYEKSAFDMTKVAAIGEHAGKLLPFTYDKGDKIMKVIEFNNELILFDRKRFEPFEKMEILDIRCTNGVGIIYFKIADCEYWLLPMKSNTFNEDLSILKNSKYGKETRT